ncbi:MAG TPA: hypothetical protein VH439_03935 [Gemmatimonadales bacterium]
MLCPHCRHAEGLHSGPAHDGRTADGRLLAPDYVAGQCGQSTRNPDGTWTPCPCPGWYPGCTELELMAATMRARAERNAVADAPFALTPEPARRTAIQGDLF